MKRLSYWIGALALSSLAAVLFAFVPLKTSPNIIRIFPDWIGEAAYFIYFLHFGVIFYGIRKRKLIYWKITPLLIWSFVLVYVSFPLYGAILGLLPWAAGLLVLTVFPLGGIIFCIWWGNQKSYFA